MFESEMCSRGDHRAPATGGSCDCGMVTRILAPRKPAPGRPPAEVLALLAQCLQAGLELDALESAAAALLQERAGRVLTALTSAGVVAGRDPGLRLVA